MELSTQLDRIKHELQQTALRFGMSEQIALDLAEASVQRIVKRLKGDRLYIPKSAKLTPGKLKTEYNGRNREQLCRRYGISKAKFYRLLSAK